MKLQATQTDAVVEVLTAFWNKHPRSGWFPKEKMPLYLSSTHSLVMTTTFKEDWVYAVGKEVSNI